jgi:hypothetical protein
MPLQRLVLFIAAGPNFTVPSGFIPDDSEDGYGSARCGVDGASVLDSVSRETYEGLCYPFL